MTSSGQFRYIYEKYLLRPYYVPGTVLGLRDVAVWKMDRQGPCSHGASALVFIVDFSPHAPGSLVLE